MSNLLVLEFNTPTARDLYTKVNGILGIDAATGKGDWPAGIVEHFAAEENGRFIVVEVWESKAAQEKFMGERLGPALQEGGAPQPTRVEWFEMIGEKK